MVTATAVTAKPVDPRESLVKQVAEMLIAKNGVTSTLEVKEALREIYPTFLWKQNTNSKGVLGVSELMDSLASQRLFNYNDNGTFREYFTTKKVRVKAAAKPVAKAPAKTPVKAKKAAPAAKILAKTTGSPSYISRAKALDLMQNNKGHFFTAIFTKSDGSNRTMNCQFLKGQLPSQLGYLKVNEASKLKSKAANPIRQINMQTLKTLIIGGKTYSIR